MDRKNTYARNLDWSLIFIVIAIIIMGIINLYSAAYNEDRPFLLNLKTLYGKQIMWFGFACFAGFVISLIDARYIRKLTIPIYLFTVTLLVAVLFTTPINGARSWLGFGSFGIQPSEFAKLGMAMMLSYQISGIKSKVINIKTVTSIIAVLLVTMALILAQNDTGTFLVFTAFLFVMYREGITFDPYVLLLTNNILGLRLKHTWVGVHFIPVLFVVVFFSVIALIFADSDQSFTLGSFVLNIPGWAYVLIVLFVGALIALLLVNRLATTRNKKRLSLIIIIGYISFSTLNGLIAIGYLKVFQSHQRTRIDLVLGKINSEEEKDGKDYNRNRGMAAVGSGGLLGNGYRNAHLASPESGHVPESETDFIFCVFAEEWGFVGSFIVVVLFTLLLIKIVTIAERQRSTYSRVYAYSVAMIIFYHFAINIGMNLGVAPVIGIPLPFFSYGGSSMISFTVMIFILLKLDAQRKEVLF
ncbi:rod shape-determining protein RodA [Lishizhenia sp.]|uniref:rod shape-determining protein RodA n=1 Tax=Lishizhenia sp. TaxID=2497594 RepID=UPI00299DFDEF|nr:rod shape-determining protein RodA [Lishizhenia sp.]MDX1445956.1 rod shape-determining protein RodA [Lishizhenia sp.]